MKFISGAESRHFFLRSPNLGAGVLSLCLNLVCLVFLWSQSFNSFFSLSGHRSSPVKVTLLSNSSHRGGIPVLPIVPSEKPSAKLGSSREIASENHKTISATGPEQLPAPEEPVIESPPASMPSSPSTDNVAFAIPSMLEFPFPLRRRGLFESSSHAPQSGPSGSGNSLAEQQWRRQNAQADSHRQMIVNVLGELNKEAKPNAAMICQTRPKTTCSVDYEPALVVLRRYEGFFADSNLREHFSFRYSEGLWSIDIKASP